ncbi:MAG: bifunctional folylpolyglutamate synthase/dihydrofolate synthase [Armatimonadetes bacterium]|nr:bifunctional folylpolyglutamate synthase/dihydrofolate synthase [Armatimonadota bacterium]
MNYLEAVAWLDSFANLERRPDPRHWTGIKLARVEWLSALLGNPHCHGRAIHIAGTKGKGSVAAMSDAILRAAGYRTGLYTSPHLVSLRERIRVDGEPIPRDGLAELVTTRLRPAAEAYAAEQPGDALSYFDLFTVLAFEWFRRAGVQWQVVEVGLGGRLDATNIVHPAVCAITPVSLDHTQFLGDTLAAIAAEKAGIIKPGVPVVLAPQPPEAGAVIRRVAAERGAEVVPAEGVEPRPGEAFVDRGFNRVVQRVNVGWPGAPPVDLSLPLLGAHQVENAAVARTLAVVAAGRGAELVNLARVRDGLREVEWRGRLQVMDRRPWVVLDGAHNPASGARLAEALGLFPHRRRYLVVGAHRDKDLDLPGNPRAASPEDLHAAAARHCERVEQRADPESALSCAREWAGESDLICITGSLYLVGAVLALFRGEDPA